MALPTRNRLRDAEELRLVMRKGVSVKKGALTLAYLPATEGLRFAIVIPAKTVRLASGRNAIRRRIAAALAPLIPRLRGAARCVVVVRNAEVPQGDALKALVTDLCSRAGLLVS